MGAYGCFHPMSVAVTMSMLTQCRWWPRRPPFRWFACDLVFRAPVSVVPFVPEGSRLDTSPRCHVKERERTGEPL